MADGLVVPIRQGNAGRGEQLTLKKCHRIVTIGKNKIFVAYSTPLAIAWINSDIFTPPVIDQKQCRENLYLIENYANLINL